MSTWATLTATVPVDEVNSETLHALTKALADAGFDPHMIRLSDGYSELRGC